MRKESRTADSDPNARSWRDEAGVVPQTLEVPAATQAIRQIRSAECHHLSAWPTVLDITVRLCDVFWACTGQILSPLHASTG